MCQRNRVCAIAVIPFLALGLFARTQGEAAPSAAPAVSEAVKTAAHSSRWSYPKEVTPGPNQKIHSVVKGDTLWDLGHTYLGNPFAWPQIWELNKWVKDPHWIYPGDPLLVEGGRAALGSGTAPEDVANLQPDIRLVPKPVLGEYGYSFPDFIQLPFLVPGTAEAYFKQIGAFKIVGEQDETRHMMAPGDFLYLGGGADQGVKVGDRLVVTVVIERKFHHPEAPRGPVLGDIVQQQGVVRVTEVHAAKSVAMVERSLDGITTEGYAAPFAEPPVITAKLRTDIASPVPIKDPLSRIIFIPETKATAAYGDMVIVDRGASDGLTVGDILLSARSVLMDPADKKSTESTNFYLGQAMVVRTGEHDATCRILRSTREILLGDVLTK